MITLIKYKETVNRLPLPPTKKWPQGVWDISPYKHGSMSLILFTPKAKDYQTPHEQDEIYIVYKGHGQLVTKDKTYHFTEGDVLFVSAGVEHRFENFSDDLELWVVFWGPKGGEP